MSAEKSESIRQRSDAKSAKVDAGVIELAEEFVSEWLVDRDWEPAAEKLAGAVEERQQFSEWREMQNQLQAGERAVLRGLIRKLVADFKDPGCHCTVQSSHCCSYALAQTLVRQWDEGI